MAEAVREQAGDGRGGERLAWERRVCIAVRACSIHAATHAHPTHPPPPRPAALTPPPNSSPLLPPTPSPCRLVDQLQALTPVVPSLIAATSLTVKGPVKFESGVVIKGDVTLTNSECGRGPGLLPTPCPCCPSPLDPLGCCGACVGHHKHRGPVSGMLSQGMGRQCGPPFSG